jgi:hypothetical protein
MKKSWLICQVALMAIAVVASASFSNTGSVNANIKLVQHLFNYPAAGKAVLVLQAHLAPDNSSTYRIKGLNFAFQLNDVIRGAAPEVTFTDKLFEGSSTPGATPYQSTEDYRAVDGRVRLIYTFNGGAVAAVGPSSTPFVTIRIVHDMKEGVGAVTWFSGLPMFYVADESNNNITGALTTLDSNLAQIPLTSTGGPSDPLWSLPLTVTSGQSVLSLLIGGDATATPGFDQLFDQAAPPSGMDYYAFLDISPTFPNYLFRDVRAWTAPYGTEIIWKIKIVNATNKTSIVAWNPATLPAAGCFLINAADAAQQNMRTVRTLTVTGNKDLTIRYSILSEVHYHFSASGYHLISLPLQVADPRVSILFPDALNSVALEWDVTTSSYKRVTSLEIGKGYWIALPAAADYTVVGQQVTTITKQYTQGWHLIGTPMGATEFTSPNDNPDNSVVTPAYGWSAGNGYAQATRLLETNSYWILVWQNCSLTLTRTAAAAKVIPPMVQGDWDEAYRLYGELPPAPPALRTEESTLALPKTHEVYANYPNPFNPTTTLRYRLAEQENVVVRVLNVRGEMVTTLVDEGQAAGYHTTAWDGKNAHGLETAGGVYFFEFLLGAKREVVKATLLR